MRAKAAFVFVLTALLYGITLASVSYVGVYLTYVALPILLISGCIAMFGGGRTNRAAKSPSLIVESMIAVTDVLGDFEKALDGVNHDLARLNRMRELKRQRTEQERALERQLGIARAKWDVHLRYASSEDEKRTARAKLAAIDARLAAVRTTVAAIDKQCEIDAIEEQCSELSKT
jgi:hypothetical protein